MGRLAALMLVPAAGILAVGYFLLVRSAADARDGAQAAANRAAWSTLRRFETLLTSQNTAEVMPELWRLEIRNGRVWQPEIRPDTDEHLKDWPLAALTKFREAEYQEFSVGSPGAALTALESAESEFNQRELKTPLTFRLAVAWQHHRAGRGTERDRILNEITQEPPGSRRDQSSLILLLLRADHTPPDWVESELNRWPLDATRTFLAHTALDRPQIAAQVAHWRQQLEVREHRFALNEKFAPLIDALVGSPTPLARRAGRDLVLWLPTAVGTGFFVAAPIAEFFDFWKKRDREGGVLWSGTIRLDPPFEPQALALGDLVAVEPETIGERTRFAVLAPGAVLAALLMFLGAGTYFVVRGARQTSAAAAARADFLAGMTHELKTPLSAIRLLSELLEDGRITTSEKRREYHRLLSAESSRLELMIENVLDLGRMERGERAYHFECVLISEVLLDVDRLFSPLAERDGMTLDVLPASGASVFADRHALTQAILSLCDNSRKYARSGGRIVLSLDLTLESVHILVRDFGPGITSHEKEKIFERFVRGHAAESQPSGGVGLGLYLAREILAAHRGTIQVVEPPVGEHGALFMLTLPRDGKESTT